jgi:hypothetical protein
MTRRPPWAITAVLGLAYVIIAPSSADLAAASYRSDLFGRSGFTLWDNGWYSGHHLPAYSVLAPALGALLDPRVLAALSATSSAVLFAALVKGHFLEPAARLGSAWFALGAGVELLSGRVPFDLGLALGLGALLTVTRSGQRPWLVAGVALAVLCSLASPVAGAFLALAALTWALTDFRASRPWVLLAGALAPILLLALAFPEGGSEPFAASAFWPALGAVTLLAVLLPSSERTLRVGALLYALALAGAYALSTPVGGNAVRLGALVAGPLVVCGLTSQSWIGFSRTPAPALAPTRHSTPAPARTPTPAPTPTSVQRHLLVVLLPFLLYWQLVAPVRDFASAASDPAVSASYYRPLLAQLEKRGATGPSHPTRIEVVPTRDHWEARWVAPQVALARGWERQLDRADNALFYEDSDLTPARYATWLRANSIAYVALGDAPLDPSGRLEASLLRNEEATQPYLREVWRSAHWRLFAVRDAQPLVNSPARLTHMTTDSFVLGTPNSGEFTVRVHFSPYWAITQGSGCVRRGPGDWTVLDTKPTGDPVSLHVRIDFSVARIFDRGPRCHT